MNDISYKIVRSNRKSIALVINSEANLIVKAPHKAKESDITNFLEKKKRWIADKQHQMSVFDEKHSPVVFECGESLLYLGNAYIIMKEAVADIRFLSTNILIPVGYTKGDLITWLKREAEVVLIERVSRYARIMGVTYSSVKLSGKKTRWGSCNSKDNLCFAWRLIMCPMAVIDYVVVHELSHITYKNHSSEFWARVKTVLPNYKEQQQWLKVNKKIMEII